MRVKPIYRTILASLVLAIVVNKPVLANEPQVEPMAALSNLSHADYAWIGQRIFENEAASQTKFLTYWNPNEAFPSFGIAHFIWFPKGVEQPFEQTFPDMYAFVASKKMAPAWLKALWHSSKSRQQPFYAPWASKGVFDAQLDSAKMKSLRYWLQNSKGEQAQFIIQSFQQRWQETIKTMPSAEQQKLNLALQRLMEFKRGKFAVIDYFNFKGIGNNETEQYQGQPWGLISVLQVMLNKLSLADESVSELESKLTGLDNEMIIKEFIESAKVRLTLRTQLAPAERKEKRWLAGWFKRVERYEAE